MSENISWKAIKSLKEPFNDATNYRGRGQKDFFQKLFLRTQDLEDILKPAVYFLMGEKGSGKTAYAVYLENNSIDGHRCKLTTMTETQYKRFVELKKNGQLRYSDYANIWRSMLLFMVGRMLVEKSKNPLSYVTGKFSKVEKEISKWSKNALNPEVESAFEAISSESLNGTLKSDWLGSVGADLKNQQAEKSSILRLSLLETENSLKLAINALKLSNDHTLFIDGVDFRPESVRYDEYLECIKGLGEAIWQLNTEYFNSIRDSKGRIKIVLLVRPDVFHELNLYNSNSRLQDNCVFLDWSTTDAEYVDSNLYEVSGRFFSAQQTAKVSPADSWNHYYPLDNIFKKMLRLSFHKPRDILTYIKITRKYAIKQKKGDLDFFYQEINSHPAVSREFSDYLLGEVKNYATFYMHSDDFPKYLKFFQYLNGMHRFSMSEFRRAFDSFKDWAQGERFHATSYLRDAESLLQLFYDVNVIGYSEQVVENASTAFYHWSYRERSANNIAPQIKTTGTLMLNPGIAKALDIGKQMLVRSEKSYARRAHADHRVNRAKKGHPRRGEPRKG